MIFSRILQNKGFIFLTYLLLAQAKFSIDIGDYPKCLTKNCDGNLNINETEQALYLSCLEQSCSIFDTKQEDYEEETKEEYANKVFKCFSQCSSLINIHNESCERDCIFDNIDESESSSSSGFDLNTFLIAISAIVGIIILFVGLVKWAYIRKNRNNRKSCIKVSPQILTSVPTAVYPAIQLNTCHKADQPIQGIPCNDKDENKPTVSIKAMPMPISIVLQDETDKPNEAYYPAKSIEVMPSITNYDKKQDIPTLQIAQIELNQNLNGESDLETPKNQQYQDKKSPSYEQESPFTPINFQFLQPSSINRQNIHIGKLNLSKLSKRQKLSEASTLTYITSKNGLTPRDHQRITSRCEFQNFLIEKSPVNNENLNPIISFRQQHLQQSRQQHLNKIGHKRAISSKSLSRLENDTPIPLIKQANQQLKQKRRSFESN